MCKLLNNLTRMSTISFSSWELVNGKFNPYFRMQGSNYLSKKCFLLLSYLTVFQKTYFGSYAKCTYSLKIWVTSLLFRNMINHMIIYEVIILFWVCRRFTEPLCNSVSVLIIIRAAQTALSKWLYSYH